jgi:hypothetical protein
MWWAQIPHRDRLVLRLVFRPTDEPGRRQHDDLQISKRPPGARREASANKLIILYVAVHNIKKFQIIFFHKCTKITHYSGPLPTSKSWQDKMVISNTHFYVYTKSVLSYGNHSHSRSVLLAKML